MSGFIVVQCDSCQDDIIWAITTRAKSMPINATPGPGGNIVLVQRHGMAPLARVLSVAKQFGVKTLYTSHFATCPKAAQHRKRGRA